jgi:hypothetical protein
MSSAESTQTSLKGVMEVRMGLGEAIIRSNALQVKMQAGIANIEEKAEYKMIMDALNNIQIDISFDCDGDGIPDSVEIFKQSANTSCCRLVEVESSRKKSTNSRVKNTSSRKKSGSSRKRRKQ